MKTLHADDDLDDMDIIKAVLEIRQLRQLIRNVWIDAGAGPHRDTLRELFEVLPEYHQDSTPRR